MQLLNRTVMIVKPKQPLLDWINSLDDSDLALEDICQDCPAYLVPDIMNDDEQDTILEAFLPDIVETELAGWYRDERAWPRIDDLETFKQWFEVSFHSMAIDLDVDPLEPEDFDPFAGPPIPDVFTQGFSDEEQDEILDRIRRWSEGFSESEACSELTEEQLAMSEDIVMSFTEFMYGYELKRPEEWEMHGVTACCLDLMPQKIIADEDYFHAIVPVLSAFFRYLAAEDVLPQGDALAEAVEEIEDDIVAQGTDPANWGLTKSVLMQAVEAGVDVTDEDELQQFIEDYNRQRDQESPGNNGGTVHRQEDVGRNDPCPCGSGKKHKHCCGKP